MNLKLSRVPCIFVASISLFVLSGCGGDGTFSPTINGQQIGQNVTVTVTPPDPTTNTGGQIQFSATVTGTSNTNVTWSVSALNNQNPGGITANGLFTAPLSIGPIVTTKQAKFLSTARRPLGDSTAQITITATSNAEPSVTGTATVTVSGGVE